MAGWHATLDPHCVIGDGDDAVSVMLVQWPIERGRARDLEPTPRLVELLDGVVGRTRAQEEFELYNWFWGTEVVSAFIGVKRIGQKTRVTNAIGGNGGKRINIYHRTDGKVLRRNLSAQAVDGAAAEEAMTEVIADAVRQRLREPARPASSGTRVLLGETVEGVWVDRTRMHGAKQTDEARFSTLYPITLDPLPHQRHLSPEDYAAHWRAIARRIEAQERAAADRPRSAPVPRSVHCPYFGAPQKRAAAMKRYRRRVQRIREATAAWRAFARGRRATPLRYPEGTHCPGAICRALPRALAQRGDPPGGRG